MGPRPKMAISAFFGTVALLFVPACADFRFPAKFLLVSAPYNASISYIMMPEHGNFSGKPVPLIDHGLVHPQGIAVDQKRDRLFVADPNLNKLVAYRLSVEGGSFLRVGEQETIANNVEVRWVAVDGQGNVFFSDELGNKILKVTADQVAAKDTEAQEAFSGASHLVNTPGGLASDNFHVYWANKKEGADTGVLVRGDQWSLGAEGAKTTVLSKDVEKSYGVCLSSTNVFYTLPESTVYVAKKLATDVGTTIKLSSDFGAPRGCVWDGSGSVYVADRVRNSVYKVPGDMAMLEEDVKVTHAFDHHDAFGLAVYSGASAVRAAWATVLSLAVTLAAFMSF